MSLGCIFQPLIPARTNASRRLNSVLLFPFDLTFDISRDRSGETSLKPFGRVLLKILSMQLTILPYS